MISRSRPDRPARSRQGACREMNAALWRGGAGSAENPLACMVFGRWTPIGSWGAALLFGLTYAIQTQLQFGGINIPHQFIGMLPYIVTIVVLAGVGGRVRSPAADGIPYTKE